MERTDLGTEFEKISDKAKTATDKLKAANLRNKDQLETDVARARDKAAATAGQFKHKADGAHDQASSQWQEIRGKWQAHVTKVRTNVKNKQARFDAKEAATDADIAEAYALDAIDFAQGAIEEAEYAALDAMYARSEADALSS
jgi:hypothetical protein